MSKTFTAKNPTTGQPVGSEILEWDQAQTNAAIKAAANAKHKLSATTPTQRAAVLNAIADAIEAEKDNLAQTANLETALPLPRLTGEVMRFFRWRGRRWQAHGPRGDQRRPEQD